MSNENLTEFKVRIKLIRNNLGLNREEFGKSVNVSGAYIGQLESGKKDNPSELFLGSIERVHKVNLVWLRDGTGPIYKDEAIGTKESGPFYDLERDQDPLISEMVSIMLNLDQPARSDLLRQAKKELELKLLKLHNQVKSEVIDALEPRTFEQQRKLRSKEEPVAEKQTGPSTAINTDLEKTLP